MLALRPNERPFVMTRASYAGGQRYAVTWTGDNSSTWNHLRMTVPQLVNLGLSGFAFAGADVGGFAGSPPPDLLTKWLEIAAFQPIDRDHSAKGTRMHEPWVDGPEQEAIRRHYIEERYRLMPYLYTVAEETSRDGMPMMRPLFMEFPHATADGSPDRPDHRRQRVPCWARTCWSRRILRRKRSRLTNSTCRPAPGTTTGPAIALASAPVVRHATPRCAMRCCRASASC